MILGIGIDLVGISRFQEKLTATPRLLERFFVPSERLLKPRSLAARFAAKEAVVKALGGSEGFGFQDIEVQGGRSERPQLILHGGAKERAEQLGVTKTHLSLSHDEDFATAIVILEGD